MNNMFSNKQIERFKLIKLEHLVDAPSVQKKILNEEVFLIMKWLHSYLKAYIEDNLVLRLERNVIKNYSQSNQVDVIDIISDVKLIVKDTNNYFYSKLLLLSDNRIVLLAQNENQYDFIVEVFEMIVSKNGNMDLNLLRLSLMQDAVYEYYPTSFKQEVDLYQIEIKKLKK